MSVPLSGVKKEVAVTEILRGTDGQPRRQQGSMLQEFNIKLLPMSIANAQPGAWTPVTMFGGAGGAGGAGNASNLIDLFTAKAARDLGVDMAVSGKAATAKK